MYWVWFFGSIVVVVGIIFFTTDAFRYLQTFYLIRKVTPYEQVGTGNKTLLVLGDSTGYGTGATKSEDSIAGRIGQAYPRLSITNDSVNGRRLNALLPIIQQWSDDYHVDVVLLQIGANDIISKQSADETLSHLRLLLEVLSPHAGHIVMMTAGNVGGTPVFDEEDKKVYEALSREYYKKFEVIDAELENYTFVNLFEEPENDRFITDTKRYIALDQLHPTSDGYAIWFEKLRPTLETIF